MHFARLFPSQDRRFREKDSGNEAAADPDFAASCNLRDMGTHLCALPTGEHCPEGLICLGCAHAQPKKSAVPIFRRMLASHERRRNPLCRATHILRRVTPINLLRVYLA